jgi:hypothetical protein
LHEKEGTFVMVYTKTSFSPMKIDVQMQNAEQLLISPCPKDPIAQMSEAKLAQLPAYDRVNISGIEK